MVDPKTESHVGQSVEATDKQACGEKQRERESHFQDNHSTAQLCMPGGATEAFS